MVTEGATSLASIALAGGINLTYSIVCITVGIIAMVVGYKVFDKITPFDTAKILEKDPRAVGIFYGLIALGISVCSGLIIGMSCN